MPKQHKPLQTTTYKDNLRPNYDTFFNPYNDPGNDIWEGRKPHHIEAETGYPEYQTWFGSVRLNPEGKVIIADVRLNHKVSIFICGDLLHIIDIRYAGDPRAWGYQARNGQREEIWPASEPLEDECIDKMLDPSNIDCEVWKWVCARARGIWLEEINHRDPLRRYYPEHGLAR